METFSDILIGKIPDERFKNVFCVGDEAISKHLIAQELKNLGYIYGCSLRRLEQITNKFESIITYSSEKEPELLLDASILIQLLIEFEISKFRGIYDARVSSNKNDITIPKDFVSNSLPASKNPLDHVVLIMHGQEFYSMPSTRSFINKNLFSWRLLRLSQYSTAKNKRLIREVVDKFRSQLNGDSTLYHRYLNSVNVLSNNFFIASAEDYYKFVELAGHHRV